MEQDNTAHTRKHSNSVQESHGIVELEEFAPVADAHDLVKAERGGHDSLEEEGGDENVEVLSHILGVW